MKDKAVIEITKEEAALLPLLYKVPLSTNLEAAAQVMKNRLVVDGLIEKIKVAFTDEAPRAETPPAPSVKPRRNRH